MFISPPLPSAPDPRLRGKDLLLKLKDTLLPNTTYSVSFGQAIADLTEGNLLKGFTYVFSTGDFVDSLSLKGKVISAFDHQPKKNVFVTLYINNNDSLPFDSLPLKVPPYYLTKTDEQGEFTIGNLQQADFKLMAIDDQNSDLIFNQPTEKIAFYDTLVKPYFIEPPKKYIADSTVKDSTKVQKEKKSSLPPEKQRRADSARQADSVKTLNARYPSYVLRQFEEVDSMQRIIKTSSPREGMILFTFKYPYKNLNFIPLNIDSVSSWALHEYSPKRDSATLWLTGPHPDTIVLQVSDNETIIDTMEIDLVIRSKPKKEEKDAPPARLTYTTNGSGGFIQYRSEFTITFSYPLSKWNFNRVLLIDGKDTLNPDCNFTDSLKRRIVVSHKWNEEKSYRLFIPDSVFYGINNLTHDTLRIEIKTKAPKDFGNMVLDFKPFRQGQYIVQVLNEKESILFEEQIVTGAAKLKFDYMVPGKFKVKAILDRNSNRRWDTGNYKKKLQPEEVFYLPKTLEIRANWDIEESWEL